MGIIQPTTVLFQQSFQVFLLSHQVILRAPLEGNAEDGKGIGESLASQFVQEPD